MYEGVPLLRIVDIKEDRVETSAVHRISKALDSEFSRSRLKGGEVLLSIQGTIGRVAICPPTLAGANISRTIAVIDPDDRVEPTFLRLYLMYLAAPGRYDVSGTTRDSLNISTIREIEVPVPPLDEQRRIVTILEDHLSRLDAGAASLKGLLNRLDSYRLALFGVAMDGSVGDRRFDSTGWPRLTLDDLQADGAASITDGPFGSNLKSSHYTATGARVIRLQNVGLGEFLDAEAYISLEHFESLRRHEAAEGDLIVASLGEVLPRVCILPDLRGPAIVKADCIRVRLGEQVRPRWVLMSMLTPHARRWAKEQLHGVGRMRLGLRAIRGFSLPVPDLATQDAILDAVDDQLRRKATVQAGARKAVRLGEALQRSLLSAAFSGQLMKESSGV